MDCDGLFPCLNCLFNKTECKKIGEMETRNVDLEESNTLTKENIAEIKIKKENDEEKIFKFEEIDKRMEDVLMEMDTIASHSIRNEDIFYFGMENSSNKKNTPKTQLIQPIFSTNEEIEQQEKSIRDKLNIIKERQNNRDNKINKKKTNQIKNKERELGIINQSTVYQANYNSYSSSYQGKNITHKIQKNNSVNNDNPSLRKKKKTITFIKMIENEEIMQQNMENCEDDSTEDDEEISKKIEEIRYKKLMLKQKIEEMENQRKEILPIDFGSNDQDNLLIPNVPSIFLPKLGIKSGTMYFTLTFEKNMPDNYYNPRNIVLEDASENFTMTLGFTPPQILGIKLGFLTPNYSQEEMEKYSKGLLSVCTKDVNYIRILSFRKTANGNVIAFDQVSVMYNYNGKPHKA
eukprot:TRINITY_DN1437_c0_g1_i5.p1 TRINITY_DN1437_c0_g1~~TRINITY_DN1437_c0_g1_i5.p1  ORF type:complete len:436 (-),score=125.50 TRINITY_DN1437_c0_g1_i5:117-1331(-)